MNVARRSHSTIPKLFDEIGGVNIQTFPLTTNKYYVSCCRDGELYEYICEIRGDVTHFILIVNGAYRLVSYNLADITKELKQLADQPGYIIPKNNEAVRLSQQ